MGRTVEGTIAAYKARVAKTKRYFTGLKCRNGHIAERLVSNGTCIDCLYARARKNPQWFVEAEKRRRKRLETDRVFGAYRRAQKAASERKRRQRDDVKATRAAERRARQAAQLQRTPKWADLKEISKFYRRARKLTKQTGREWHVDHEIPLQGRLVSGLHVAENLRVILATTNLSKGSTFMS